MFDRMSEYALNKKDKEAIIYSDAFGNITRLTAEDFSSEKEFRKWKNWVDMKTHSDEKNEHIHSNHTISFAIFEAVIGEVPDVGACFLQAEEMTDHSQQIDFLIGFVKGCLSETQYRRMWLYYVEGMDTYEMASREGITHQAISDSLQAARKKIMKYLKKHLAKKADYRR